MGVRVRACEHARVHKFSWGVSSLKLNARHEPPRLIPRVRRDESVQTSQRRPFGT